VLRIAILYRTFLLLRRGAYGGKNEIRALEEIRIDAADGVLDGMHDAKLLRRQGTIKGHRYSLDFDASDGLKIKSATQEARERLGVTKDATGGFMTSFMWYDLCALSATLVAYSVALASFGFGPWMDSSWMFWSTLYFAKVTYGLLSFPFIVFTVPILGQALHHAQRTAYDQSGTLVPKLAVRQMKEKQARKEKIAKEGRPQRGESYEAMRPPLQRLLLVPLEGVRQRMVVQPARLIREVFAGSRKEEREGRQYDRI